MSDQAARRAERLLRLYPPSWRRRYGEEFTELLIEDMAERPRSWVRSVDVIRSGVLARFASAGLTGGTLAPEEQIRAGLGWLWGAVLAFLALGIALWSQLTIGWQWSAPAARATTAGMMVMSAAILAFFILALLSAIPIAGTLCLALVRREGRALVLPLALTVAGAVAFTLGSLHFGHGWPGTGGHPWTGRALVLPASVARFGWAATLWVTSYWAHPGALASFPAAEVGWMVVSPLALLAIGVGVATTVRRTRISPGVLRYEAWLGSAAAVAMAAFLAGAGSWVISGGPAPRGLFRVGAIDSAGLVAMTAALVLACRAAQRTLAAGPSGRTKR